MIETTTVRYTTVKYTGWQRILRQLTFRATEGPTYEFEATFEPATEWLPGLPSDDSDTTCLSYTFKPIGPIRKIEP